MTDDPKPVLWVGLTDSGRAAPPDDESLRSLAADISDAVGDDYHVIVADDRVRLADADDLRELRDAIDGLVRPPGEDAATRRQQRREDDGGLSVTDVMDGGDDAHSADDSDADDDPEP